MSKNVVLSCDNYEASWTSAAHAIFNAVNFVKEGFSLVEIMGYTGHAFRININAEDVDVAGPTYFDWEKVFQRGLRNLGFNSKTMRTADHVPPTPQELRDAIALIQDSIDRGIPVISWDLFIPEFGSIYGYDDVKQEFMAKDPNGDGALPYEKLGRGQVSELFIATITDSFEVDKKEMLKGALEMAIEHGYERENHKKLQNDPYTTGIQGYDAWIEAFEGGKVSEFGNAYNSAVVSDARRFAVKFFERMVELWADNDSILSLSQRATELYRKVSENLNEIAKLYPFPSGGNPNDSYNTRVTIEYLKKAKQNELEALKVLEEMLGVLSE